MNNLTPIARKLATFHIKNRNPTAPVSFAPETCTLTLANGDQVNLTHWIDCDLPLPANFNEGCAAWSAIKAGRPPPVIERYKVVEREIVKLLAGFSPAAKEKLLAAAQEIEGEQWVEHWRAQSARMGKLTH